MNETDKFALVPRAPSALEKAEPGAKRVMAGMVADTLALAVKGTRPPRIVLVEDEDHLLRFYEHYIHVWSKNATLLPFQNRDEAWQELLRADPDLLITDMNNDNIPGRTQYFGMSGWTMLTLLAERKAKYAILIISGSFAIKGVEDKARLSAGSDLNVSFLTKPFKWAQFSLELRKHLGPGDNLNHPMGER